MRPTNMPFTRTLWGAPSPASTLVSAMPAARDTAVGAPPAGGALAPVLSTLMIRPQRRCFMPGKTRRTARIAANSFNSRSSTHSASVISSKGMRREVPALLTRISTGPNAFSAVAMRRSMSSALPTSATQAQTLPSPADSTSSRVCSNTSSRRAVIQTWAPAAAKLSAMARPRPRLLPVIRATRPSILQSICYSSLPREAT